MKRLYRIALFVESSRASGRHLIQAVSSFASMRGDWVLEYHESTLDIDLAEKIQGWQGDGVITRITSVEQAATLVHNGIPTLDLLGSKSHPSITSIHTDNDAIAQLATAMFMRKGYVKFAFCGYPGICFSDARQQAFEKMAKHLGISCASYQNLNSQSAVVWERESWHLFREKNLTEWLLLLPKPAAIFACNDTRALQISAACRLAGIRVPEECLILGVDNDEIICGMSTPAISSIEPDFAKQGQRGAEVLQDMMDMGADFVPFSEAIAPKTVVERSSTDFAVFKTPFVAEAVRLIGNHA